MLSLLCFVFELRRDGTAGEQSVEDAVVGSLMPLGCASELVPLVSMPNHLLPSTRRLCCVLQDVSLHLLRQRQNLQRLPIMQGTSHLQRLG